MYKFTFADERFKRFTIYCVSPNALCLGFLKIKKKSFTHLHYIVLSEHKQLSTLKCTISKKDENLKPLEISNF